MSRSIDEHPFTTAYQSPTTRHGSRGSGRSVRLLGRSVVRFCGRPVGRKAGRRSLGCSEVRSSVRPVARRSAAIVRNVEGGERLHDPGGECYRDGVSQPVRFGVFEFSAYSGELTRDGRPVRLQPQPARVLAHLIAHAGELITRDELRQTIWSDGTFVDFERGLNFCIAQIRSALGDAAESPRFIETVPRRGYRFIAPVTLKTGQPSGTIQRVAEPSTPIELVMGPRPTVSRASWIALIALAIVTAALVASSWRTGGHLARIAVVPFDNETGLDDFDQI